MYAMEDAFLYTCISLAIFLFAFKLILSSTKSYKNLPPSPPSLPIIGHLHLLKSPPHRTLHRLSQKYGPVITLWFGSRRVVIVSSPSAVEECFTKNDIVLADRPLLLVGKYVGYNFTNLISTSYGDHWRNLRRMGSTEIFSSSRLNMFSGIRKDETIRLLHKLLRKSSEGDFAKVELKSMLTELTLNIIMRMVAGKPYSGDEVINKDEEQRFKEIVWEVSAYAGASHAEDFLPILSWITGYEKRLQRLGERTDSYLQNLIEEHRMKIEKTSRNSIIDHLLSLQELQPEYYTDQIIKGFILSN
ncbi:hypothetical protein FEM48_Zijuj08G0124600 [Ziziphus jujuba var. spinosa]|uniref:Isoflavone 3'-hydroxylase-like n=1 Tax=Ziziphus jujuba var. spinosa TaxID=714518 RepID=A0A978UZ38_ZIZJJ|nr:hypothetical protein FEM48_Zijuj08G0124600 [Ziziphus jujuba var. spinosa]